MKIYHTETQEDFDELLKKMKKEGYHWWPDKVIKPDDSRLWRYLKQNTVVYVEEEELCYGTLPYAKAEYPNIPIETYKAKKNSEELSDISEEVLGAVVKFWDTWNEKGPVGDYTDIMSIINKYADKIQLFKDSSFGVSSGFDKDGVFHSDNVNNPAHYTSGGIETLDYIKAKVNDYPSYAVGNIVKYVSRYEHKNGLEDLKKAQFYLNDLIKEMEKGA
ncbi:DUF3310 domain-containing protein [Listeria seeligeri]|uniref:DUF3310 domain-containing protein n=1 Tax=Listeria seeligeri TaxID=1640 RepID=UPI0022EAB315|nr:DUF3310 domain-containing protein [Listeria seeligeri]